MEISKALLLMFNKLDGKLITLIEFDKNNNVRFVYDGIKYVIQSYGFIEVVDGLCLSHGITAKRMESKLFY